MLAYDGTHAHTAKKKPDNHGGRALTDLELAIRHELLGSEESARFSTLVDIHFHSYRFKLADSDGLSGKAVLDGIVACGLLSDDTAKEVREVTHSQEAIPRTENERVTITITAVV